MNKERLVNRCRLLRHFCQLARSFGLVAAVRIDIMQHFKTVRYKHDYILSYLEKRYSNVIGKYRDAEQAAAEIPSKVWVCWFQGEAQMPETVRRCFESIKEHAGRRRVQLVTRDNCRQFVKLPPYITDKVEQGKISLTHFSDILRSHLLADHGGVWIDAALLLTEELQMPRLPFFSIKLRKPENDDSFVSGYRWVAGFMAGAKGNVLHSFMKDFFNAYWEQETMLMDYFLVDYAIAVAYRNISSVKKMIDAVPCTNEDFYYLKDNLFRPADRARLKQALGRTGIFYIGCKGFPKAISDASLYRLLFH